MRLFNATKEMQFWLNGQKRFAAPAVLTAEPIRQKDGTNYLLILWHEKVIFFLSRAVIEARAQDNEREPKETFTAGAYLDLYYNDNFNEPSDGNNAYFVSYNRHNEINVNLGYAALNYKTPHFKSRLALGAGTYMNANYAAESGTLKNIAEASVAVRLSKKRNYWMEAGVLSSPYTNESA